MIILAISGSTRKKSYNTLLLKSFKKAAETLPSETKVEVITLGGMPIFSEDLEDTLPQEIQDLISKANAADAFVVATPEYNGMISGVLKNTMEWLSRSYAKDAITGKPIAIMGATPGGFGAVLAQDQMLKLALTLGFSVSPRLTFPVSKANTVFGEDGSITDAHTLEKLEEFVKGFVS